MSKFIKISIPLLLSVSLMLAISIFSSQTGTLSSGISIKVTRFLAKIIFFNFNEISPSLQDSIILAFNGFVRKLAHFIIYAFLGINVFIITLNLLKSFKNQIILTVLICTLYASIDEIRQSFVSGRDGRVLDIILDACGSITGIIIVILVLSVIYYIKNILNITPKVKSCVISSEDLYPITRRKTK